MTNCAMLERELVGYANDMGVAVPPAAEAPRSIATPMRLRTESGDLALMTMIATFGTALDITLAELDARDVPSGGFGDRRGAVRAHEFPPGLSPSTP